MIQKAGSCLGRSQLPVGAADDQHRNGEGQQIRHGEGVQNAVQTPDNRHQNGQEDTKDDLPEHGNGSGFSGLAQSLQIDEGTLIHRGQRQHTQVDSEAADGKRCIVCALVGSAEDVNELLGEHFHNKQCHQTHEELTGQQVSKQLLCAILPFGTDVVADDGNTAGSHANGNRDSDLEELHDDAQNGKGDLGIRSLTKDGVQGTILGTHILDSGHREHQRDLSKEAGEAQGQELLHKTAPDAKAGFVQLYRLHMQQIPNGKSGSYHLTCDGGDGRAGNTQLRAAEQAVDHNGVQNHIDDGAGNSAAHGELGASVRADDGVHGLAEHIERDAQADVEEILLGEGIGLRVDLGTKHGQNLFREAKVSCHQDQAGKDAQQDGVANAFVGLFRVLLPQADADKGAGTVTDHDSDAQSQHRQGENHRGGGVAIGAQEGCVGDEDLVNDIVQGTYDQRNNTGNGIPAHQRSHLLGYEKCVCLFHSVKITS